MLEFLTALKSYFGKSTCNSILQLKQRITQLESDLANTSLTTCVHDNRKIEFLQSKLSFYRMLTDTSHTYFSAEVVRLIESYESTIDSLYNNQESSSYYLLAQLKSLVSKEIDFELKGSLKAAIEICEIRILLLSTDLKILQMQLAAALELTWFAITVPVKLELAKHKYTDYENIELFYRANIFYIKFKILLEIFLPSAMFLQQLMLLDAVYEQPGITQATITDMYVMAFAREEADKLQQLKQQQEQEEHRAAEQKSMLLLL